ncbi:MAG: AAA family ATPase [Candidatus Margulisiibacteriota bacterium]
MKIIEKIEIKHFRSFDGGVGQTKIEVLELKDINIFSGANDSGKSNILRVLNLFFNNEVSPGVPFDLDRDLSKIQKNRSDVKAKTKRESGKKDVRQKDLWVKIRVYFKKEQGGVLPERFFVEKTWDKNGLHPSKKHNIKKNADFKRARAQEGQLSQFLHNISFEYVPAVKDRQFFNLLFKKLQNYLFEKQDKKNDNKFTKHSLKFNDLLKTETQSLFDEFKKNVGIDAGFRIPETLVDFFRTLGVETENGISLFDRGDGIQARFIPDILNEISRDSRKKVIWGSEEPENSYEPLRCFELAQDFVKYSEKKQIFITSHAFPFIGLKGDNVASFRVKNEGNVSRVGMINWNQRTIKGIGFENDTDELEKEVGILEMYLRMSTHLGREVNKRKYYVFVEDSKKQIYKIAWLKLNNCNPTKESFEKLFDEKSPFNIFDKNGSKNLYNYLDAPAIDELEKQKIIGIFDFDASYHDFNGLHSARWDSVSGNKNNCLYRKRKNHNCFYALLIPVPLSRNAYADICFTHSYLILEHLFEDDALNKISCLDGFSTPSGGARITKIKGRGALWEQLFKLPKKDFSNFKPLFNRINELFGL